MEERDNQRPLPNDRKRSTSADVRGCYRSTGEIMVASRDSGAHTSTSIRPRYKPVSVEALDFDSDNPRFGGAAKGFDQDQIQALLEQNPHYAKELIPSFVENGFIAYEPLVVRERGTRFVVIEGNRRLAAIRYILSNTQEFSDEVRNRFLRIPVLIFPSRAADRIHQDAVRVYLGIHHLFGFREWPPESKA